MYISHSYNVTCVCYFGVTRFKNKEAYIDTFGAVTDYSHQNSFLFHAIFEPKNHVSLINEI